MLVAHSMIFLGFVINATNLTIEWPTAKQSDLAAQIQSVLLIKRYVTTPKIISSIIGKLCSAAIIAPWGVYMTLKNFYLEEVS